jgi:hypothetical protein
MSLVDCGICNKSIELQGPKATDDRVISERTAKQLKISGVNFHYDCLTEHDELLTQDEANDQEREPDFDWSDND